jgi:predicted permease
MLLVGSGLMVRSFQELRSVDPGFSPEGLMTFRLSPPPGKYPGGESTAQFYDQLVERLEAIPGAEVAAGINNLPLTGGGAILTTQIDDFPTPEGEFPPTFLIRRTTPGYFEAMGVPIVEGREFIPEDHNGRLGSMIISESIKRQYWPNESALGKRLTTAGAPARVVGVVGDLHDTGLEIPAEQFVYKPMLDSVGGGVRPMMMTVRTSGDPNLLVPGIRAAVEGIDPDLPITDLQTMDDILADSLSRTSFTMTLLVLAAVVALFLGSVGIYGVLSYVASQRTAEMGVRLALGADAGTIRKIILSQGMVLAALGIAVGLGGSIALGGVLSSLLFGVSPADPVTLVSVSVVFLAVAAASSLIPAERAARTPPQVAMRGD